MKIAGIKSDRRAIVFDSEIQIAHPFVNGAQVIVDQRAARVQSQRLQQVVACIPELPRVAPNQRPIHVRIREIGKKRYRRVKIFQGEIPHSESLVRDPSPVQDEAALLLGDLPLFERLAEQTDGQRVFPPILRLKSFARQLTRRLPERGERTAERPKQDDRRHPDSPGTESLAEYPRFLLGLRFLGRECGY